MNENIIQRYNEVVTDNDEVYVLGDCALGDTKLGIECMRQLKGKKYLAIGNHDTDNRISMYIDAKIFDRIEFGYRIRGPGHQNFLLTHYPLVVENFDGREGRIAVHGHTHAKNPISEYGYNVCVDAHDCYPVPLEKISLKGDYNEQIC